jgi:tRNA pseudouridine38-40 synthase
LIFFDLRYFIELAYNGTLYHGWQVQPKAVSVQERLNNGLTLLLKSKIEIVGAGRTDAGVHAKQMFAHFDCAVDFEPKKIIHKLNSFLPNDIAIINIFEVHAEAHARFDAIKRTYEYHIHTKKNPFLTNDSWSFGLPLHIENMNKACQLLLEYDDFECFSKTHSDVNTFFCKITEAYWEKVEDKLIFTISADRFLRNMVRAIVGTMISIGLEKIDITQFRKIIESKNRSEAGYSAPAHGLYLAKIEYPYLSEK